INRSMNGRRAADLRWSAADCGFRRLCVLTQIENVAIRYISGYIHLRHFNFKWAISKRMHVNVGLPVTILRAEGGYSWRTNTDFQVAFRTVSLEGKFLCISTVNHRSVQRRYADNRRDGVLEHLDRRRNNDIAAPIDSI